MTRSDDLMTREEAAVYLGCSFSWLAHGNGPPSLRIGRGIKYSRKAIDKWIERNLGERQCSIETRADESGSSNSSTAGKRSVSRQARQIAAELRSKVAASASSTSKKTALVVVGRELP